MVSVAASRVMLAAYVFLAVGYLLLAFDHAGLDFTTFLGTS